MKNLIMIFAIIMFCISAHSQTTQSDTIWVKEIGSQVKTVKFSPDGKYIYAAAIGRKPMKLNAETGEILMEYDTFKYEATEHFSALDISTDGKWLIGGEYGNNIYIIETESGKVLKTLKTDYKEIQSNKFNTVTITPDKRYVIATNRFGLDAFVTMNAILIWDVMTGELIKSTNSKDAMKVKASPDNKNIAVSYYDESPTAIKIIQISTWETSATLCCHSSLIQDIAFSPDGSMLASCGWGGEIKVWDIEKKQIKTELKSDNYYSTSIICVDELNIIAGGYAFTTGGVELWKTNQTTPYKKYRIGLYDLDYLQSKKLLSVASGTSITLIDLSLVLNVVPNSRNEFSISPNPSNSLININFSLQQSGNANVEILDINSNQISLLFKGFLEEGNHNFQWQTHSITSGTYFCRISTQTNSITFKIIKQE